MAMFHVAFLVRATKLGDVMEDLDGKVANLEIRLVKTTEVKSANTTPRKAGVKKSRVGAAVADQVRKAVEAIPTEDFRASDLWDRLQRKGFDRGRSSAGLALKALVDEGVVAKTGTGSSTVYHRRAA